jgi:hypothetical protein
MVELIPYFSGFVTLLFALAFYFGLQEIKSETKEVKDSN